jgi:rhodanese-related sulfurtransferase
VRCNIPPPFVQQKRTTDLCKDTIDYSIILLLPLIKSLFVSVSLFSSLKQKMLSFARRGGFGVRFYTNVNKTDLKIKMAHKPALLVVDVRNGDEIAQTGILQHKDVAAKNVPLGDLEGALKLSDEEFKRKFQFEKPKPTTEIIFSCRSGKRSASASQVAEALGYKNVYNYTGGANDWFNE